jgi:tRNA pseudouridine38-40 synthase
VEVQGETRGEVRIWVEGDAFLRHMVRILAGTLVEVGIGRRDPGSMPAVLAARERPRAGRTAPARGLCLVRVDYA